MKELEFYQTLQEKIAKKDIAQSVDSIERPALAVAPEIAAEMPDLSVFLPLKPEETENEKKELKAQFESMTAMVSSDKKEITGKSEDAPLGSSVGKEGKEIFAPELVQPDEQEEETLEEDFVTLEAQKAYYGFMASLDSLDMKTGKGVKEFIQASKNLDKNFENISLKKMFTVVIALMGKLMEAFGYQQEKEAKSELKPVQTYSEEGQELPEDVIGKEPEYSPEINKAFIQASRISQKFPIAA